MNSTRIETLQNQAVIEPLVWTPRKGEVLIGNYVKLRCFEGGLILLWLKDNYGVTHRVSLNNKLARQMISAMKDGELTANDLVSVQFVEIDKNCWGGKQEVYKLVIDRF